MQNFFKAVISLLLFTGMATAQSLPPQPSPFLISDIKATEVSKGVVDVELTTTTVQEVVPVATVPVPTSSLLLTGSVPLGQLVESNILGSFMAADLDGNSLPGPVLLRETDKGLRFNGVLVEPMGTKMGPQEPYRENGKMRSYLLDPDGTWFSVLYYTPPELGLLLTHRLERPKVLELPNPNLQLVVFEHSEPVENQAFLPKPPTFKLTIDGKPPTEQHLLYAWEPALFQSLKLSPRWLRAYWIVIPLDPKPNVTEHKLQVTTGLGSSSLGLYAQINYATEKGVRQRSNRSTGLIWSPPKSQSPAADK